MATEALEVLAEAGLFKRTGTAPAPVEDEST
jgi:hypothetical protein